MQLFPRGNQKNKEATMRSDKVKYFLLGVVASMLLFFALASSSDSDRGRYEMVDTSQGTLVLDTHTGAVVKIDIRGRILSDSEHIPASQIQEKLRSTE
jgi:hypothetical protein